MLTFNTLLRHEGIDPKRVKLLRHQDNRGSMRWMAYTLWRNNRSQLEWYQRIQRKARFAAGDLLASFVATPSRETLFVGLYSVTGRGTVPPGTRDPIGGHDVTGMKLYDIQPDNRLAEYEGRLTIHWGRGYKTWNQRADRQDKTILEIRGELGPLEAQDDEEEFPEGRVLFRAHRSRERNRTLVKKAKALALKKYGKLVCEVCGFEFAARYGKLGADYIECHHAVPISQIAPGTKTKVADLRLLCSNCHRMVHKRRPWLAVGELTALLAT